MYDTNKAEVLSCAVYWFNWTDITESLIYNQRVIRQQLHSLYCQTQEQIQDQIWDFLGLMFVLDQQKDLACPCLQRLFDQTHRRSLPGSFTPCGLIHSLIHSLSEQ